MIRTTCSLILASCLVLASCSNKRLDVGHDRADAGDGGIDAGASGSGATHGTGGAGGSGASPGPDVPNDGRADGPAAETIAVGGSGGKGAGGVSGTGGSAGQDAARDSAQPSPDGGIDVAPVDGGAQRILEFRSWTSESFPYNIALGPDGNLWYTDSDIKNYVGRITPNGTLASFGVGSGGSVVGIAAGPDGNLWLTDSGYHEILQVDTEGRTLAQYPLPDKTGVPVLITAGPDGALWYTDRGRNRIGRITTAGVISEFAIPTANSNPWGIVVGPDKNLWFTERDGNKIGRLTVEGAFTELEVPTPASAPSYITAGPDGALWFTENAGNKIGRVTTNGSVTELAIPTPASGPLGITAGPDGAVWFTENLGDKIGRITTDGQVTEYPLRAESGPYAIVANATDLWFTENAFARSTIGRLTPEGKPLTPYFRLSASDDMGFAGNPPGVTSSPDMVTVTGTGSTSSGRLTVRMETQPEGAQFSKRTDTCDGASLANRESCSISADFMASIPSRTSYTTRIVVTPEFGDAVTIALRGSCLPCTLSATYWLDFGDVAMGTTSAPQAITVTNLGNVACRSLVVGLAAASSTCARFSIGANKCGGATLNPGDSCKLSVSLQATCTSSSDFTSAISITPEEGDPVSTNLLGSCPPKTPS